MPILTRASVAALATAAATAVAVIAAAPASAASGDTVNPTNSGTVSYSANPVDTTYGDASTTVSIPLSDNSSGVSSATLTLTSATSGATTDIDLDRASGTATSGVWSGLQTFSTFYDATGTWSPTQLVVSDTAGNTATITSGLGSSVTVNRITDSTAPTVQGDSGSVSSIDTSADSVAVPVRVQAGDDLSGVATITASFKSPDGDSSADGTVSAGTAPVQGTRTNGYWDVPVTFPARSAAGVWTLDSITVTDAQNNSTTYDSSVSGFTALQVNVRTDDDGAAPTMTSYKVGPAKRSTLYGRDGVVYAQVGFTDQVSGLATAQVVLQRPDGTVDDAESDPVDWTSADIKSGTSRSGTITVPVYVSNFVAGTWTTASVVLTDAAGNSTTIPTASLGTNAGFVVSGDKDTLAPTIKASAFSPEAIDTRNGSADGSVLVSAKDPDAVPSGIDNGTVTLTSPSGAQSATAAFTSNDMVDGDLSDGTFRAAFTLNGNAESGNWTITDVTATDGAGHTVKTRPASPTLSVLGANSAPITVPGAPGAPKATIADSTATVTWTAPSATGGGRITGYRVTTLRGATLLPRVTVSGSTYSAQISGLTHGQSYTFTVAATNAAGTGPESDVVSANVAAGAPDAPIVGRADVSGTTGTVSWSAPASDGGNAITNYRVTPAVTSGGATSVSAVTVGASVTSASFADLARGRTYTFTVAAINAAGTGAQSVASNAITVSPIAPAAPNVTTARVEGTTATVAWTPPADNGGSAITAYRVVGSPSGSCTTSGTSCTIGGLTPTQSYTFTVLASNAVGAGNASAPSATVVAQQPLATVASLTGAPATIEYGGAATVTGRVLAVTGAAAPGVTTQLQYQRSGSSAWTTAAATTSGGDGAVAFGGFRPATTVLVRLVALGSGGFTGSVSATRTISVTRQVTIGSSKVSAKRGAVVRFTGRAAPARSGSVVTLQRSTRGVWHNVASARVSRGMYSFTVKTRSRGHFAYRVVTRGDGSYAASVSRSQTLRVR